MTREEIVDMTREWLNSGDIGNDEDVQGYLENPEEWEFDRGEAVLVLTYLDVPDPGERVEMLNSTLLDIEDIIVLANLDFWIVTCDMCGEDVYRLKPDNWDRLQGIDTKGEIGPVMINGKEKQICGECYDNPIFH